MPVTKTTVIEGTSIEVHDIPLQRALAIGAEYGPAMSTQKVAALLAASTNLTATEIERLPAKTYAKVCGEVMNRLNARMAAARR